MQCPVHLICQMAKCQNDTAARNLAVFRQPRAFSKQAKTVAAKRVTTGTFPKISEPSSIISIIQRCFAIQPWAAGKRAVKQRCKGEETAGSTSTSRCIRERVLGSNSGRERWMHHGSAAQQQQQLPTTTTVPVCVLREMKFECCVLKRSACQPVLWPRNERSECKIKAIL